jgi:hypothetical protein
LCSVCLGWSGQELKTKPLTRRAKSVKNQSIGFDLDIEKELRAGCVWEKWRRTKGKASRTERESPQKTGKCSVNEVENCRKTKLRFSNYLLAIQIACESRE